jgi:hypothetical protein
MTTIFSLIGQLIDLINMLWDISPISFIIGLIILSIGGFYSYLIVRETIENPNAYPKGYLEFQKRCKNSK